MSPFFKTVYQLYKWIIVVPFFFIATMVLGSICIAAGMILNQGYAVNLIAVTWARLCCRVVPVSVRIEGRENYVKGASYIVVANHQSMADIPVLLGYLGLRIKFIMKKELQKIPVFGYACHQLGCIYVDRSNHAAAMQSIKEAKEKLARSASVLFFAEGTRSRDGLLLPFKIGAFRFAKEVGLPILPITVRNSIRILPSDSADLRPGTVHVTVHPPVDLSDVDIDNLEPVMKKTRDIIKSAL